jgi:hypothetical protein
VFPGAKMYVFRFMVLGTPTVLPRFEQGLLTIII